MEQSNRADLQSWVAALENSLGWNTAPTDEGDWGLETGSGVRILVESDAEIGTQTLYLTAFVGTVDEATPAARLLAFLAFNMTAGQTGMPFYSYRAASKALTVALVFVGTTATWNADSFFALLGEFCRLADTLFQALQENQFDLVNVAVEPAHHTGQSFA